MASVTASSVWQGRQCFSSSARPHKRARGTLRVRATSWDPEGLFKAAPQEGLIERKMFQQQIQGDREFSRKMEEFAAQQRLEVQKKREQRLEVQKKREARKVPEQMEDLIEFFLDTEAPEMEFEVARCRPMLGDDFFAYLDRRIGLERFANVPDEERLAELETLRDYLKEAVEAVDKAASSLAAPQDRLKKLLAAQDKKACLLDMAANNEIDRALIDLLDQNIESATEAKQEKVVEFMTKVKQAALRYMVTK
ncbi:hypothetical protein C2E21_4432 [Chlorella sorokiniana]|uniref:Uncharacterized protein n=1 Tax=Chlorella sorokiniana TaxID=3076 RepID=A0A2P6TRM3_CHLSO|nr:hypothetical protein C2E21_4432 [Chlorella sorokiniana]|eukprot:PRW56710.1 hypothetical protein C2E21_4432 [Chlorella sorokiniana]